MTSNSSQSVITLVFGLIATIISIITVWQGYKFWKTWHGREHDGREHDQEEIGDLEAQVNSGMLHCIDAISVAFVLNGPVESQAQDHIIASTGSVELDDMPHELSSSSIATPDTVSVEPFSNMMLTADGAAPAADGTTSAITPVDRASSQI